MEVRYTLHEASSKPEQLNTVNNNNCKNLPMDEENNLPRQFKERNGNGEQEQGQDEFDNDNFEEESVNLKQENHDDSYDDLGYEATQFQETSDNNNLIHPPDDNNGHDEDNENDDDNNVDGGQVPSSNNDDNNHINDDSSDNFQAKHDPNVWVLPLERNDCTLEEIRRGQVINKTAPNECPVLGCGKKINEMRLEPSPGTIASGLRTHVLFVHYANRKVAKKRKLGWTNKRRNSQASPKKQISQMSSPSASVRDYDLDSQSSFAPINQTAGLNLIHKSLLSSPQAPAPGSILNKKVKQIAARSQSHQMSSLQSLMQATGGGVGPRLSPQPKPNNLTSNGAQKNFNSTTSSLFSILAGLTQQQQQMNQQQQPTSLLRPDVKHNPPSSSINLSQCSRNPIINNNNNRPANSSLLSLLNEKISGNVANSLQSQLKKSLGSESLRSKLATSTARQNLPSPARQNLPSPANSSYHQSNINDIGFSNNSSSLLNNLCPGNGDNRSSYDNSMPLNSFIESIALRTGSNIGQAGVVEVKRIIEKFTTSLICSSQTIADHYLAPFVGDVPQQKPEISPSDVVLAYKMMHKSHGQP